MMQSAGYVPVDGEDNRIGRKLLSAENKVDVPVVLAAATAPHPPSSPHGRNTEVEMAMAGHRW